MAELKYNLFLVVSLAIESIRNMSRDVIIIIISTLSLLGFNQLGQKFHASNHKLISYAAILHFLGVSQYARTLLDVPLMKQPTWKFKWMQIRQKNNESLQNPFNYSRLGFNLCASKLWEKARFLHSGRLPAARECVRPYTMPCKHKYPGEFSARAFFPEKKITVTSVSHFYSACPSLSSIALAT